MYSVHLILAVEAVEDASGTSFTESPPHVHPPVTMVNIATRMHDQCLAEDSQLESHVVCK